MQSGPGHNIIWLATGVGKGGSRERQPPIPPETVVLSSRIERVHGYGALGEYIIQSRKKHSWVEKTNLSKVETKLVNL